MARGLTQRLKAKFGLFIRQGFASGARIIRLHPWIGWQHNRQWAVRAVHALHLERPARALYRRVQVSQMSMVSSDQGSYGLAPLSTRGRQIERELWKLVTDARKE